MIASNASVLIVGAGPTGLTTAAILRRYGVSFRIVDKAPHASRYTKASNLMQRNQEIVAALGLLDPIAEIGGSMRRIMTHAYGKNFGPRTMRLASSPFRDVLLCGQNVFEAEMARGLAAWGTTIEFGTELTGLVQTETGVDARFSRAGAPSTARFDYVVGADGANGITRSFTTFDFTPKKTGVGLRQVDCKLAWRRLTTMDQMWLFYFDRGFAVVVPLPGGVHRIITVQPKADMPERAPTLAEMQAKLREVVSDETVALSEMEWSSYSDLSMGIADGLRDGRILLAGDVGNPILPNGGQGMNTGISDAFNLGWKLASILLGGAPESLLDTYDRERHSLRLALENAQYNSLKYTTLVTPAVVRRLFAAFGNFVLDRGGEDALARTFSQLDLTTRRSPLTLDRSAAKGLRAGDRVLDADVTDGSRSLRLFDLLYSGSWTLLAFTGRDPRAAGATLRAFESLDARGFVKYLVSTDAAIDASDEVLYDLDEVAHRAWGVRRPMFFLVRPDGYVGARVGPRDLEALAAYIETWLPQRALAFDVPTGAFAHAR